MRAHKIFSKQYSSTAPHGTLLFVGGWDLHWTLNALKRLRYQHWVRRSSFQALHAGLGREKPLVLCPEICLAAQGAFCPRGRNLHFWIVGTNFQQSELLKYTYRIPLQGNDGIQLLNSLNEISDGRYSIDTFETILRYFLSILAYLIFVSIDTVCLYRYANKSPMLVVGKSVKS